MWTLTKPLVNGGDEAVVGVLRLPGGGVLLLPGRVLRRRGAVSLQDASAPAAPANDYSPERGRSRRRRCETDDRHRCRRRRQLRRRRRRARRPRGGVAAGKDGYHLSPGNFSLEIYPIDDAASMFHVTTNLTPGSMGNPTRGACGTTPRASSTSITHRRPTPPLRKRREGATTPPRPPPRAPRRLWRPRRSPRRCTCARSSSSR